ncbi:hypothetical protein H312_00508 [Anncaliia algerae PRA339]|uniref:Uncharacterized protein n=1 Tax=Anncaliia algerae PRA339 TaxID=1288291 RepID=A0A059F4Z7_9MICR|nr:hypothetical protein H312_00508 [Anncaliia algerae PRA339]
MKIFEICVFWIQKLQCGLPINTSNLLFYTQSIPQSFLMPINPPIAYVFLPEQPNYSSHFPITQPSLENFFPQVVPIERTNIENSNSFSINNPPNMRAQNETLNQSNIHTGQMCLNTGHLNRSTKYNEFLEGLRKNINFGKVNILQTYFLNYRLNSLDCTKFVGKLRIAFNNPYMNKNLNLAIKDKIICLLVEHFRQNYYNAIIFYIFYCHFSNGLENIYFSETDKLLYIRIFSIKLNMFQRVPLKFLLTEWKHNFYLSSGVGIYQILIDLFIEEYKSSEFIMLKIEERFRSFKIRAYFALKIFLK